MNSSVIIARESLELHGLEYNDLHFEVAQLQKPWFQKTNSDVQYVPVTVNLATSLETNSAAYYLG